MAKEKDTKVIAEKVCVTTSALLEIFEMDDSTLVRWEKRGCPKVKRGWWSIKDVLDWRSATFDKEKDIEDMNFTEKKVYYEGKLKEAQLETVELKNKIAKGEYIEKEEIVDELKRFLTILKRSMTAYSKKIATELSHLVDNTEARRMENLIKETTENVLSQLSIDGVYETKGKKKTEI